MKHKATGLMAVWVAAAGLLVGCGESSEPRQEGAPYKVAATVGMVADIVRQVAGDKVQVEGIIGEGVDPHLYRPTAQAVKTLQGADVVFYSGLMLEGKMADMLVKLARKRPVYAVTELIDEASLLSPADMEGHYDPHVWMDVQAWKKGVEAVAQSLGDFDEPNKAYYQANATAYMKQLDELDAYAKRVIASVPKRYRIMVTAHDAFNYFGRAYGLQVEGVQGLSTESEAGLEDINRLVDMVVGRDIRAVFVETSVSDKNVRALIEGARSRGKEVVVGGHLFSDAMGESGTYEGTYMGMIDHNATTIARALGGDAPAGGMQGKLGKHGH